MNAYEVILEVDGKAVTRTEWAHNASDAFQMALMNASADAMGMARSLRLIHIGPPQAEVLRAQASLVKAIGETIGGLISSGRRGPR